jgi:hypothetical protein
MNTVTESTRKDEVEKAYNQIIERLIQLHITFNAPHFRKFAQLQDPHTTAPEFISRFININLSSDGQTIFYGKSSNATYEIGKEASTEMIRILFRATAKESTSINIEDCLDDQYFHLPSYFSALNNPEAEIFLGEPN